MGTAPGGTVEVHYQPIVDLRTGQVDAVEALARWRDDAGRLLEPAAFIGAAERTSRIADVGRAVRAIAVPEVVAWSQWLGRPLDLHVNVSPHELEATLVPSLLAELAASGLPAEQLVLEITEARPFTDDPEAATVVQVARDHGVRVALDDFGVGWSSIDRIRSVDVDMVKVDRSFVADDGTTPRSLTSAIVAYARRRGLQVVAEGIERPEQVAGLVAMGCRRGQGFLLARPGTATDVAALLGASPTSNLVTARAGR